MDILVNGEKKALQHKTLNQALIAWGYTMDMPMAIAVNRKVIPNSAYESVQLQANDEIEILMPMQGG